MVKELKVSGLGLIWFDNLGIFGGESLRVWAEKERSRNLHTQKTVMVKEKENYPVRIDLRTRENFEAYQDFETLMILGGKDAGKWLSELVMEAISGMVKNVQSAVLNGREIVSGEKLRQISLERYGDRLTRNDLKILRQTIWEEGKEYYSAPNGKMRVFRYNLERCLPALQGLAAKRF